MATVRPKYRGENVESLLRRFNKQVEKEGIMEDMKKHEFYVSPSLKRKKKSELAQKRAAKALAKKEKMKI